MNANEPEPTREELLAMAYADGELPPEEAREFERLLETRGDLRTDVARARRLAVLARQAAGPEPMDAEWARLARDPLQRAGLGLGWTLLASAAAFTFGWGAFAVWNSSLALFAKLALSAAVLGLALLFAAAVRARLRTRAFDPYTEIRR